MVVLLPWVPPLAQGQPLPSAVQPGVIEKSLRQSRPIYKPPVPDIIPDITIEDSSKMEDAGAGPSFFVQKIEIEGNTLISNEILEPLVDLKGGMELSLGILNLYAHEITAYYTSRGYILARAFIPAQEVKDGVVTIRVVEGKIGERLVVGNTRVDGESILERMWRVEEGKGLEEHALQRSLLELNDILGIETKSILKPGKMQGTSDLVVKVKETHPYKFSFDADNFGSEFTGRNRFGVSAVTGNIFGLGDQFSFRGVRSDLGQIFAQPAYMFYLHPYSTTFKFAFTYSQHELGGFLKSLEAEGDAFIYSMAFNHPILRTKAYRMSASLGVELRNFRNFQLGVLTSKDNLRDVVFGIAGDFEDPLRARTFVKLSYRQGTGARNTSRLLNSRFGGHGDLPVATLSLLRFQSAKILNSYFIFNARGQVTTKRVVSPNLFSIGGAGTVRGYPLAEHSGDNGYTLSAEYVLPFPFAIPVGLGKKHTLDKILSFSGFIEHGKVFVIDKQPGEKDREITGVGGGIRINIPKIKPLWPAVSFSANYAVPQFIGPLPSDGSFGAFYFSGLLTFF